MVRVNIIEPGALADQHLVAEYRELLMLLGSVRKNPLMNSVGAHFMKNPIRYFSDKLSYIEKRHAKLRAEMKRRGFAPKITPRMSIYPRTRKHDFAPNKTQLREIKKRLIERLRNPPRDGFYKYYRKDVPTAFLVRLVQEAQALCA